jgi:hypothetical protein
MRRFFKPCQSLIRPRVVGLIHIRSDAFGVNDDGLQRVSDIEFQSIHDLCQINVLTQPVAKFRLCLNDDGIGGVDVRQRGRESFF